MKLLLVLLAVLFGAWLWRSRRVAERPPTPRRPAQLQDMVTCQVCGLHLPSTEALHTGRGVYCGDAHRQQAER
jgi:uncharacterized protein